MHIQRICWEALLVLGVCGSFECFFYDFFSFSFLFLVYDGVAHDLGWLAGDLDLGGANYW